MIKYFVGLFFFLTIVSCQKEKHIQGTVELLDSTVFQKLLNENRDNILVVNVWATWCAPCVEEMPDLIKLAEAYETENVQIIGISIDYPEEIQSKVLPFIYKQQLNFPVYVNDFENDEALINTLNEKWSGSIPATFIYDKTGEQKEILLGKHSFQEFKKIIEKYL